MTTPGTLGPLRVEISGTGKFKSIEPLVWDNIPPFAILTGVNGSGKTQLLEFLAYRLTSTSHPQLGDMGPLQVTTGPDTFGPESVALVPSSWDMQQVPALGVQQLTELKRNLYQQLINPHQIANSLLQRAKRAKLEKLLNRPLHEVPVEQFLKDFPDDYAFMLEEEDVISGLTHVLVAHKLRMADELLAGKPLEHLDLLVGKAPWDVINEALRGADFGYELVSPISTKFEDIYQFQLRERASGVEIPPSSLSSGEKAILRTLLWLFNTRHGKHFVKLLLLDEPDAHLHPSMTQQFLSVVKNVLVDQYGIRVIMTTHAPSTVALAPEGSVFEMYRSVPRIRASPSLAHSVGLLSSGLVVVSKTTRFVLVEDQDDVTFYTTLWNILTIQTLGSAGPDVPATPSLVFLSSSPAGRGGGKTVVEAWVAKFNHPPLDEIFRGAIDLDTGNAATSRIKVLSRYSIENYKLDPFVVYGLLVEAKQAPAVPGVAITPGDEHLIRTFDLPKMQGIVDSIATRIEPSLPGLTTSERARTAVVFTSGQQVEYPTWMLTRPGKDLLPTYQTAFGGPNVITPPGLMRLMQRVRLIPSELAQLFRMLQS